MLYFICVFKDSYKNNGLINSNIPFMYVAIADGGIKVFFGIVLFLSKNPRERMTNNKTEAF